MTGGTVIVVCTVIATVVGVVGFLLKVRDTARKQAESDQLRELRIKGESFSEGARSRDDEVRLVTSERDQARYDRSEERKDNTRLRTELDQARAELAAERNRRGH